MRYKSLPVALRGTPADPPRRPSRKSTPKPRWVDWVATLPIIVLLPALALVADATRAGVPMLIGPTLAATGDTVEVRGLGHRPGSTVQLTWSESGNGMAIALVGEGGDFVLQVTIPPLASPGEHRILSTYVLPNERIKQAHKPVAELTLQIMDSASVGPEVTSTTDGEDADAASRGALTPTHASSTDSPSARTEPLASPDQLTSPSDQLTPDSEIGSAVPSASANIVASATPLPPPSATSAPVWTPAPTPQPSESPSPAPPQNQTPGCSVVITTGSSVAHAMGQASAGQTICLRGGIYAQNFSLDPPNGTAWAPITLTSYPGERAVLVGLVSLSGLDYWSITDVSFTWGGGAYDQHMVKINGGVGWTLAGVEMYGARSFANLLVWGSPVNWTIRNSVFRDTYGGEDDGSRSHNLYVNAPNGLGGLIEGNTFLNAPKGYNVKLAGSSAGTDGTDNVVFRANTLSSANRANLVVGNAADNIVIENNAFSASNDGWALRLYDLRGSGNVARNNRYAQSSFCNDYESAIRCADVVGSGNTP